MNSIDCRNQTFDSIQRSLNALRLAAHCAWLDHGPGTTREVAKKSAIDVKKRKTALDKLVTRQKHSCERATAHIARRMAILQGRIDS